MTILATDWIAFHADRTPEKTALIDQVSGRAYTYAQFNAAAAALAGYLRDVWGAKRGDRLAILAKNSAEYFVFEFACIKLGALMLPLNWRLAEPELQFILRDAAPIGLLYDTEFSERIPKLRPFISHLLRFDLDDTLISDNAPIYTQAIAANHVPVVMDAYTTHDDPLT